MAAHTQSSSRLFLPGFPGFLRGFVFSLGSPCVPPVSLHALPVSGIELQVKLLGGKGRKLSFGLWLSRSPVPGFVLSPVPLCQEGRGR